MSEPLWHPLARGIAPEWASEWGQDRYGVWAAFRVGDVSHRMRWLPAGRFLMGSPEGEKGRYDDEDLHEVTLTEDFWLGETACTQELWRAVMSANPADFEGGENPVENVSFEDVGAFCDKLGTEVEGLDPRVPTEAEWEYACRAGSQTAYSWGDSFDARRARSGDDPDRGTRPVRFYKPNSWGLYEMHGNVREWCADAWVEHLGHESVVDPLTESSEGGSSRVVRGGSWILLPQVLRSAFRLWYDPGVRSADLGFRLARGPSSARSAE